LQDGFAKPAVFIFRDPTRVSKINLVFLHP